MLPTIPKLAATIGLVNISSNCEVFALLIGANVTKVGNEVGCREGHIVGVVGAEVGFFVDFLVGAGVFFLVGLFVVGFFVGASVVGFLVGADEVGLPVNAGCVGMFVGHTQLV